MYLRTKPECALFSTGLSSRFLSLVPNWRKSRSQETEVRSQKTEGRRLEAAFKGQDRQVIEKDGFTSFQFPVSSFNNLGLAKAAFEASRETMLRCGIAQWLRFRSLGIDPQMARSSR